MFELNEQARAILAALGGVPEVAGASWLDDDGMLAAAPARMPAAWLALERLDLTGTGVPPGMGLVTWAVMLKTKRLREQGGERPILAVADAVIDALHGLRGPAIWARPLCFTRLECLELESEAACHVLRFTTQIYQRQTPRPTGGVIINP